MTIPVTQAGQKNKSVPLPRKFIPLVLLSLSVIGCATVPRIPKIDPPAISSEKSAYADKDIYLTRFGLAGLSEKDTEKDVEHLRQKFIEYLAERGRYRKVIDATGHREQVPHDPDSLTMEASISIVLEDKFNYFLGFPVFWPYVGFWPYLPRSGSATVEGTVHLLDSNKNIIGDRTWKRKEPFNYAFYGWYRTQPIRDVLKVAFEDVFSNISILTPVTYAGKPYPIKATSFVRSDVDEVPETGSKKLAHKGYAVIIGIEHYRQELPPADFANRDAQIITQYVTKVLGYPEENVITLLDDHAAKSDFEKYFEKWLSNNVEAGDVVFIYYSGHGAPDPKTRSAYLVPYDGDPSFIDQTGYPLQKMYDALGKLPAKEIIVALDACFSGAGGRSILAKGARPLVLSLQNSFIPSGNITVMTAASGDQISSTYDEKGHGLFTYFFLKGIRNEDVVKRDGSLEIKDLYAYVKPQVETIARKKYNNEQSPQLIKSKESY